MKMGTTGIVRLLPLLVVSGLFPAACQAAPGQGQAAAAIDVAVANPSDFPRPQALIRLAPPDAFHPDTAPAPWILDGGCRRPAQWAHEPESAASPALLFTVDLAAHQRKDVKLVRDGAGTPLCAGLYPARATLVENDQDGKRTSVAATTVPKDHAPGRDLYGFEGIGWESGKVGYRVYLDKRNAIDIYGKRLPAPVLEHLALNRISYHDLASWGMDILKVGSSLGMGSIAAVVDGKLAGFDEYDRQTARVIENGPVRAAVNVAFDGWRPGGRETDLQSRYEIAAGSWLTHVVIATTNPDVALATGVVRHDGTRRLKPKAERAWRYVASCGVQSLVPDMLGLAVFYPADADGGEVADAHSYAVRLRPDADGRLSYYFAALWEKDSGAFADCDAVWNFLENTAERLSAPVSVTLGAPSQ